MQVYLCVYMDMHVEYPQSLEQETPELELQVIIGHCSWVPGTGVLFKNITCSYPLSHPSSPTKYES